MRIMCSCCGAKEEFQYSVGNVLTIVVGHGWGSCGGALYCPECSATWDERNKGRPMADYKNTIARIDELHQRSERKR